MGAKVEMVETLKTISHKMRVGTSTVRSRHRGRAEPLRSFVVCALARRESRGHK